MNKIYRVVWNFAVMAWTVVSELGRGRLKRHPPKNCRDLGFAAMGWLHLCCYSSLERPRL